jgi:protein phosphatase
MRVAWGASTHTGLVRRRNEDAIIADPPIFAVADGMGGHTAGNIASERAVTMLGALVARGSVSRADILETIRAVDADLTRLDSGDVGAPGTTVSGVALIGWPGEVPSALVFNVGDSRCYRLRADSLVQLTRDHSVVQELLEAGEITADEATRHPERNVITRSLGGGGPLDIDWWITEPEVGDRFLVCSDGLFRELPPTELAAILSTSHTAGDATDRLLSAALDAGARDNVSVIVLELIESDPAPDSGTDGIDDDTEPRSGAVNADTSSPVAQVPRGTTDG